MNEWTVNEVNDPCLRVHSLIYLSICPPFPSFPRFTRSYSHYGIGKVDKGEWPCEQGTGTQERNEGSFCIRGRLSERNERGREPSFRSFPSLIHSFLHLVLVGVYWANERAKAHPRTRVKWMLWSQAVPFFNRLLTHSLHSFVLCGFKGEETKRTSERGNESKNTAEKRTKVETVWTNWGTQGRSWWRRERPTLIHLFAYSLRSFSSGLYGESLWTNTPNDWMNEVMKWISKRNIRAKPPPNRTSFSSSSHPLCIRSSVRDRERRERNAGIMPKQIMGWEKEERRREVRRDTTELHLWTCNPAFISGAPLMLNGFISSRDSRI